MRTRVPLIGLAILSLAGTCSHPRPRAPETDDQREGATSLDVSGDTDRAELSGTLAPGDGDTVDWLTVTLPPGPRRIEVDLRVDGPHLPAAIELYDSRGAIVSNLDRRPGKTRSTARASTIAGGGRVFVRIADDTDASTIRYAFSIDDLGNVEPPGPPPCDPHHWDVNNPRCETVCNLADLDLGREACCVVMQPCVRRPRGRSWGDCVSPKPRVEADTIIAPVGTDHARLQALDAYLDLDDHSREPLTLVEARAKESVWRLMIPKAHDMTWLEAHAKSVVIQAPGVCKYLGTGRP